MAASGSLATATSPEPTFFSSTRGPLWPAEPYCWSKAYLPTVIGTVFITVDLIHNTTAITTVYKTQVSKSGSLSIFTPPTTTDSEGTVTQSKEGVAFTYPTGYTAVSPSLTWSAILPTSFPESAGSCCYKQATTAFLAPSHLPVVGAVDTIDPDDPYGWFRTLIVCPPYETVLQPPQVSSIYNNRTLGFAYTGCAYTSCHFSQTGVAAASAFAQVVGIFATSMTTLSSLSSSSVIPSTSSSQTSVQAIPQTLPQPRSDSLTSISTTSRSASPTSSTSSPQGTTESPIPSRIGPQSPRPPPEAQTGTALSAFADPPGGQTRTALADHSIPPQTQTPSLPPITLGSTIIQPDSASRFVVGSQTLIPGSSITVSSQIITYPAPITPAPPLPPITIGTQVITASSSVYIIDDQTLVPGAKVTVSGTTIQLAATPSQIIVGTDTAALATGNTGGYIWSGLGSAASSTGAVTSSPTPYRGGSSRSTPGYAAAVIAVVACMLWM